MAPSVRLSSSGQPREFDHSGYAAVSLPPVGGPGRPAALPGLGRVLGRTRLHPAHRHPGRPGDQPSPGVRAQLQRGHPAETADARGPAHRVLRRRAPWPGRAQRHVPERTHRALPARGAAAALPVCHAIGGAGRREDRFRDDQRRARLHLGHRHGDRLPEVRGDWTPYWEDGAGSSAAETALNRASSERLTQAEALWAMLAPAHYPASRFTGPVPAPSRGIPRHLFARRARARAARC
jgi:hypothetical protein